MLISEWKSLFATSIVVVMLGVTVTGCKQLLAEKASPSSPPIILGAASTNDPNAIALLELARAANAHLNQTPTGELVDKIFAGLLALTSGAVGFYARHQVGKSPTT